MLDTEILYRFEFEFGQNDTLSRLSASRLCTSPLNQIKEFYCLPFWTSCNPLCLALARFKPNHSLNLALPNHSLCRCIWPLNIHNSICISFYCLLPNVYANRVTSLSALGSQNKTGICPWMSEVQRTNHIPIRRSSNLHLAIKRHHQTEPPNKLVPWKPRDYFSQKNSKNGLQLRTQQKSTLDKHNTATKTFRQRDEKPHSSNWAVSSHTGLIVFSREAGKSMALFLYNCK